MHVCVYTYIYNAYMQYILYIHMLNKHVYNGLVCFGSLPADINECTETPGICGKNTVCTNVPGTFFCSCPDGFYPSTGILWLVGTSFCKSEQNKSTKLSGFFCTIVIFFDLLTGIDEVLNEIVPQEVRPNKAFYSESFLEYIAVHIEWIIIELLTYHLHLCRARQKRRPSWAK